MLGERLDHRHRHRPFLQVLDLVFLQRLPLLLAVLVAEALVLARDERAA